MTTSTSYVALGQDGSQKESRERHRDDGEINLKEVGRVRAEISHMQRRAAERRRRFDELHDLQALWNNRVSTMLLEVHDLDAQVVSRQTQLENLLYRPTDEGPLPPGPECVRFVDQTSFTLIASLIILANIVTMMMELMHKHYEQDFFVLDQLFMIFYLVEVTLKAVLWRDELLFGKCAVVWWNWLDLIIVFSGVLDMWVQPMLISAFGNDNSGPKGHSSLALVRLARLTRVLRLARLTRILKLVKVFLLSDLTWAEESHFQTFIMGVIGFNSIVIGFECDYPDFVLWFYVEQILLIIFTFEVAVRLKLYGPQFFYDADGLVWNWLDSIIVMGGIIDQWLMPCIAIAKHLLGDNSDSSSGNTAHILMLLRMARLLRVLRLVRLIRGIPALYNLVMSIMTAMKGMMWVLVLMVVLLYLCAILGVQLISHGLVFGGDAPDEVKDIFPSVLKSIFLLFNVVNGETRALEPLFNIMPFAQFVFMIFTVLSSWGILSILTAVVSENMMRTAEAHKKEVDELAVRERSERSRVKLEEIFDAADENDSSNLTEDEFEGLMWDELRFEELRDATGLNKVDFKDLFKYLSSVDDSTGIPSISREAFLDGLQNENRPVSERSIMRLESRLADVERVLRKMNGQAVRSG